MSEQLKYIVEDSTIAEILGVQNFSNKESAILELVKNAYDAHARNLNISISSSCIIMRDDGVGMDRETIHTHWMHVGKSPKGYLEDGRVMAGSKGIGRFALARLGSSVTMVSCRKGNVPIRWMTDWNSSHVEELQDSISEGTTISINQLRDKWNKKGVERLISFLSRSCNDEEMRIEVTFDDEVYVVQNYLKDVKSGKDYVWHLRMSYQCNEQNLKCEFVGDEFQAIAQEYCQESIGQFRDCISIADEFSDGLNASEVLELRKELQLVGDFEADLYFQNIPSAFDCEKFLYKSHTGLSRKDGGIALYRNAFSISGYEGYRDWLELGKRSRKSPAAASHPTGAWRVRENQMLGQVHIDKAKNYLLMDLSNRQGMEENNAYRLFIDIIISGISRFERYRQSLIRSIDKKNKKEKKNEPERSPLINRVLAEPKQLAVLGASEQRGLAKEIREERKQSESQKRVWAETEQRYRYDIRLLNTLATLGLRSSSMAHELSNDRSNIATNSENIIDALKAYGYWDALSSVENTRVQYRNVPALLEIAQKIESKMLVFMDVMLTEIEKEKFLVKENDIHEIVSRIAMKWKRDYSKLNISIQSGIKPVFVIAEDIIASILDNLILNTIQQNDSRSSIEIEIKFNIFDNRLHFSYSDNGVGLPQKYKNEPMRILEVHETSRENGHGLGMWIVNNSIHYTGGKVVSITSKAGFGFEFELGSDM